jgi:hypothetical protein
MFAKPNTFLFFPSDRYALIVLPGSEAKDMKTGLLFLLMALAICSLPESKLYAQAKEYTPLHPTAADTMPKASIITEVLPSRSVTFRLKAPDARQVSVLVGFSNPPTAMAPSYALKKVTTEFGR